MIVLLFILLNANGFAEEKIDACTKLGGKSKSVTKKSDDTLSSLCLFGKTALLEKTVTHEFWKEQTMALNKLSKSDFQKNIRAVKKMKFDPFNKESQAVKSCRLNEGTILDVKDNLGNVYQICRFADYSGIEVEAYLRGKRDPSNIKALGIRNVKLVMKKPKQKIIEIGNDN